MKKIKYILVIIILYLIVKADVFAATANFSVSSSNVNIGDTFNATVNLNAAAWDISINSTGPVSGCKKHEVNDSGTGYNASTSISVTCTATGEGTATITVSGDITDENGDNPNVSDSKQVTITKKPTVAVLPSNNDNNNNNNDNNNNNTETTPQPEQLEKSNNNKLKELTSDKGTIVKVDDNNFTLEVTNNISEVTIKATPEDAKAKVLGDGVKKLSVGDNKVEITITSETGEQNKILLLIKRKDGYYIDDLNTVLATSTDNNLSFKIKSDSIITTEQLATIKTSGKTINLDYYNDTNKLMYSWIIDAKSLDQASENFNTNVEFSSKNEEKIKELSQNTSGIITSINSSTKIPKGTKLKVYLGRNYKTGNKVKIYYYDESTKKLNTIEEEVNTEDGYVEFRVDSPGDYYFTKIQDEVSNNTSNDSGILLPVSIGVLVIGLISFLISLIVAKKRKKQQEESIDE